MLPAAARSRPGPGEGRSGDGLGKVDERTQTHRRQRHPRQLVLHLAEAEAVVEGGGISGKGISNSSRGCDATVPERAARRSSNLSGGGASCSRHEQACRTTPRLSTIGVSKARAAPKRASAECCGMCVLVLVLCWCWCFAVVPCRCAGACGDLPVGGGSTVGQQADALDSSGYGYAHARARRCLCVVVLRVCGCLWCACVQRAVCVPTVNSHCGDGRAEEGNGEL